MKYAHAAMNQILTYYIGMFVAIVVISIFSFTWKKANKTYIFGIVLCLVAIFSIVPFINFMKDYLGNNVVVQQGEYENKIGGRGTSFSDNIGLYSVTLTTGEEEINLTTAPGNQGLFIMGKHEVVAYYLPNSKWLLYMEFISPIP